MSWSAARDGAGLAATRARGFEGEREPERAPLPGFTLARRSVPPIRSTSFLQIASPRPVPPKRRVVDASAWMKLSKRRACCVASMPMPVSVTSKRTPIAVAMLRFLADSEDDLAGVGELDRVAEQVDEDLADAAWVAAHPHGHLRIDHDRKLEILLVRLGRDQLRRLLDHDAEVEVDHLDVDLARLDLREVEDVVDDREQRLRGLADRLRILALLGVQRWW